METHHKNRGNVYTVYRNGKEELTVYTILDEWYLQYYGFRPVALASGYDAKVLIEQLKNAA